MSDDEKEWKPRTIRADEYPFELKPKEKDAITEGLKKLDEQNAELAKAKLKRGMLDAADGPHWLADIIRKDCLRMIRKDLSSMQKNMKKEEIASIRQLRPDESHKVVTYFKAMTDFLKKEDSKRKELKKGFDKLTTEEIEEEVKKLLKDDE